VRPATLISLLMILACLASACGSGGDSEALLACIEKRVAAQRKLGRVPERGSTLASAIAMQCEKDLADAGRPAR
jgi:hypothetical protein